jgi:hypothetical protein
MERNEIQQRGLVRNGDSLKRAGSATGDKFKSTELARRGGTHQRWLIYNMILMQQLGPLTFGTSASLNLLSAEEQELCRQIRMNPQSYIAAKATIIRESRKRGDELSRKQARDLLKCDINKTGRIWDFLVRNGVIKAPLEPPMSAISAVDTSISLANGLLNGGPANG